MNGKCMKRTLDRFQRFVGMWTLAVGITGATQHITIASELPISETAFKSHLNNGDPNSDLDFVVFNQPDFCDSPDAFAYRPTHRLEQLSFFSGIDGSKQPQDYGVNANLGLQFRCQYAAPLVEQCGLGFQVGSSLVSTDNAVRVFELLGEDRDRLQSFTTVGLFQRVGRWGWGGVFDYLYQDGFDESSLGQVRTRLSYDVTASTQVGVTARIRAFDDRAEFLGNPVTLRSINQGSFFLRHFFETGVQTTCWLGLAEEHGESNAAFGPAPSRADSFVFGADFVAPLNDSFAIYGETNLISPADTGTVDAFLGLAWYPFVSAKTAHLARFSPILPVAAPTSFAVDLLP